MAKLDPYAKVNELIAAISMRMLNIKSKDDYVISKHKCPNGKNGGYVFFNPTIGIQGVYQIAVNPIRDGKVEYGVYLYHGPELGAGWTEHYKVAPDVGRQLLVIMKKFEIKEGK